jgi:AraC-like DNA-binding protein
LSYSNAVESKLLFRTNLLASEETYWAATDTIDTEYVSIPMLENTTTQELSDELLLIKDALLSELEHQQVFLNPELTLVELSKQLNTNASILSKVINKGFGQNFNDLINQYRINFVISEIGKGLHKKQTLLSIAFDCGFNSKATFNRAFKKVTNFTPVEYIQEHFR